jgi:hypothetical protein
VLVHQNIERGLGRVVTLGFARGHGADACESGIPPRVVRTKSMPMVLSMRRTVSSPSYRRFPSSVSFQRSGLTPES